MKQVEMSDECWATLMLCGSLGSRRTDGTVKPLNVREFSRLEEWLGAGGHTLSDLLGGGEGLERLAEEGDSGFEADRLGTLLSRGAAVALTVERWTNKGVWILSRTDAGYPVRLRTHLGRQTPPVLFGVGTPALLDGGGLAIVGSRNVDEVGAAFTHEAGTACGAEGIPVISGGAKGVDQISMRAGLGGGGVVVGVLADHLVRSSVVGEHRRAIMEDQMVLVTPYDPEGGFNVGKAMGRNKIIYALSDWALVVSAEFQKGGTWAGAEEELKRKRHRPVFVRVTPEMPEGNRQLAERGAVPFPEWKEGELRSELKRATEQIERPATVIQERFDF